MFAVLNLCLLWRFFDFLCVFRYYFVLVIYYMDWNFVSIKIINFNQFGREILKWIVLAYFISILTSLQDSLEFNSLL